jgi:hypothetical protein
VNLKVAGEPRGAPARKAHLWRNIMKTRAILSLTSILMFGPAIAAFSQPGFAQTNVTPSGIFQLNLAKSKFPGAPLKSQTEYYEGQKITVIGIDEKGNARAFWFEYVEDGKPHPVTGFAVIGPANSIPFPYDARTYTRVDAYTVRYTSTKVGTVVQTGTRIVSPDGKTFTSTFTNTANGEQTIQVYDKQ